tara:strand:- start:315 stop:1052 length:738 start_codon:yes stop_codon:yes gene_type:complete
MEDTNQMVSIEGVNTNENEINLNPRHARFSDLMWYDSNNPPHALVGGVGGIGSWLSFLLGRMGCHLYLFDNDEIDETNMGGQLYQPSQIGMTKVEAAHLNIYNFTGNSDIETFSKYTEESEFCPITFSCFDNMKSRKIMFDIWANSHDGNGIFIDGRMLAESFQIYAVLPGSEDKYRETLFDDSEVEEQPCSAKATSHTAAMISSMMVGIFTNYLSNIKTEMNIREVPFFTSFETHLLMLNLELQ